jgi:hypothetical protein
MKTSRLIFVLLGMLLTAFASPNPLVGKWAFKSMTLSGCTLAGSNGTTNCSATGELKCMVLSFTSDHYAITDDKMKEQSSGASAVEGNAVTMTSNGVAQHLTFKIENETLTMTGSDPQSHCTFTQTYKKAK